MAIEIAIRYVNFNNLKTEIKRNENREGCKEKLKHYFNTQRNVTHLTQWNDLTDSI